MSGIDSAQYKPLSSLQVWADNYNVGDVEAIALSIRRFGFNGALRVWGANIVMAGNHSLLALRQIKEQGANPELDRTFPPEHILVAKGEWYVRYIDVSHLDPLEAKAYAIADNQTVRLAVPDEKKLTQYLREIGERDKRLIAAMGFDEVQVQDMIRRYSTQELPAAFPEYDETIANSVKMVTCPHCGKQFPL